MLRHLSSIYKALHCIPTTGNKFTIVSEIFLKLFYFFQSLFISTLIPIFSGVPVSSRVSAKIQQLVNTLKRPKRPPLREFFVDDFEELLEGNFFSFLPLLL